MEDNVQVKVKNRIGGTVGYSIPEMQNLKRTFAEKEEKIVTFEELRRLMYVPGGEIILRNYLIIEDPEVLKALNINVEPEYFYEEKDIINLFNNGTLDEFLDCLDFAPIGVINMIKRVAISLPLNDMSKRKAILDKTGFDVTSYITLMEDQDEESEQEKHKVENKRRAAAPSLHTEGSSKSTSSGRRVS